MDKVIKFIPAILATILGFFSSGGSAIAASGLPEGDSVEIQILYNGRAWRNLYTSIKGDPFLFSDNFLKGSVRAGGVFFSNQMLKYDIYNDEILLVTRKKIVLQLNKEFIESFNLEYGEKTYYFKRLDADSLNSLSGYVRVLYEGNTSLLVKYSKEILSLAVENKYDLFSQIERVYLGREGKLHRIKGRGDLLNLLEDKKQQVHSFIRSNNIKISRKDPESFMPVLEFYDRLRNN
ncbi:MAG: hypothetical protein RBT38_07725 [Bacteroidales bacterium]|jgi:hypothetical protein|nr:hypothetical protein [Bacteroidales bacterium]